VLFQCTGNRVLFQCTGNRVLFQCTGNRVLLQHTELQIRRKELRNCRQFNVNKKTAYE